MRRPDHDQWLLSLDRKRRPKRPAQSEEPAPKKRGGSADQGAPANQPRSPGHFDRVPVTKDAFLMGLRAAARAEYHDDRWYML